MTEERVYETMQVLTDALKEYFPYTPVIPVLGNHDFEPANHQEFEEPESKYLLTIAEIWKEYFIG